MLELREGCQALRDGLATEVTEITEENSGRGRGWQKKQNVVFVFSVSSVTSVADRFSVARPVKLAQDSELNFPPYDDTEVA